MHCRVIQKKETYYKEAKKVRDNVYIYIYISASGCGAQCEAICVHFPGEHRSCIVNFNVCTLCTASLLHCITIVVVAHT